MRFTSCLLQWVSKRTLHAEMCLLRMLAKQETRECHLVLHDGSVLELPVHCLIMDMKPVGSIVSIVSLDTETESLDSTDSISTTNHAGECCDDLDDSEDFIPPPPSSSPQLDSDDSLYSLCSSSCIRLKNDHCIVFDWDDTLMASTFISGFENGDYTSDSLFDVRMKSLEFCIISLLDSAIKLGDVYIVTNSQEGWVQQCCERFLPSVWSYVQHIPIISARSTFEKEFPNDPCLWKHLATPQCIQPHHKSLISVGDADADIQVAWVTGHRANVPIKAVHFKPNPTLECVCSELIQLTRLLPLICEHPSSMLANYETKELCDQFILYSVNLTLTDNVQQPKNIAENSRVQYTSALLISCICCTNVQ